MKQVFKLYLLGVVLTLFSIFFGLMESLEGLLEGPSPGSAWTNRGQLARAEGPRGLPDHPSQPKGLR
ncbi:hypoxia-inducible lipid droplet-associated protein [Echinops telfairi]|uniref:Hypoxia-inducible lipid droplet-associated protein n=1 Tax=Echinops telfairi TaxID=9371 RepID=A0AC55CZ91_ECHTE|nr:hypoxia-inducible lipid droplet-associated protein [Echinops telfairi]